MKPPITAPTLVILGLIGLGLLTVGVRHQDRRLIECVTPRGTEGEVS